MQRLSGLRGYGIVFLLIVGCLLHTHAAAHDIEKLLFLVVDKDEVIASNTRLGRFDRLVLGPREKIVDYKVANAVAVVVTNRRFVAYGILHGGWNSRRAQPGERLVSLEVADFSATVLTSDRILNYSGRAGTWSETKR
ncbi:MAG: hypothetical protein KJO10_06440 [Gammaproteobacteria bacterium]|nr:hypothetical protein [Gammaproteobacteria bacterium]